MWRRKLNPVLKEGQVDGGNDIAGNKRKIRERQGGGKSKACLEAEQPSWSGGCRES